MTAALRPLEPPAAAADIARLFVDERLRIVPVADRGPLVGIVSRQDLLRTLVRPGEQLRSDLLRLIEPCTGDLDSWNVTVTEGWRRFSAPRAPPRCRPLPRRARCAR